MKESYDKVSRILTLKTKLGQISEASVVQKQVATLLDDWYRSALGSALEEMEEEILEQVLPGLFGYSLLQIGLPTQHQWLSKSPIAHKIFMGSAHYSPKDVSIIADEHFLPFPESSLDLILMPHALEFLDNPVKALQECARVLLPEGHLLIFAFNPCSLWGLKKIFYQRKHPFPWHGKFFTFTRLKKWLETESFQICHYQSFFYRPPFEKEKYLEKSLFLETLGKLIWPYPGGAYMIIARHKVAGLTPIRPHLKLKEVVAGNSCVHQPTIFDSKD